MFTWCLAIKIYRFLIIFHSLRPLGWLAFWLCFAHLGWYFFCTFSFLCCVYNGRRSWGDFSWQLGDVVPCGNDTWLQRWGTFGGLLANLGTRFESKQQEITWNNLALFGVSGFLRVSEGESESHGSRWVDTGSPSSLPCRRIAARLHHENISLVIRRVACRNKSEEAKKRRNAEKHAGDVGHIWKYQRKQPTSSLAKKVCVNYMQ